MRPRAAEIDASEQYPWDIAKALTEARFVGMTIPQAYGGQGCSYLDAVLVIEEMAKCCTVTARIAVETNMGAISTVMAYGSDEQKRLAAGLVLSGDKPAICITEPDAGSDALAMTTRADRRGDRYIINGRKHWITGAGVSRLHLIFARVFDEQGNDLGIGGFIAVRDEAKGLRLARRERTMGLRGMPEGELVFEDLEIAAGMAVLPPSGFPPRVCRPDDRLQQPARRRRHRRDGHRGRRARSRRRLGEEPRAVRPPDRRIPGPAMDARRHADPAHRVAADALRGRTLARARARSFPDPMLAAQAKIFASEAAIRIVNDALQMFGARGYSRDLPLERMARDVRMFTIGGGTAQVLRTLVASRLLGWKLPQTRDGYVEDSATRLAAE